MIRALLAGGGTAGHIEPALNTADELLLLDPSAQIRALGTTRGLEQRLVPARGYELDLIPAVPLPRRPNRDLIALPRRMRHSVAEVRALMNEHQINVVVGFGGYVATPAYLAARGRVPIVIHEANAKAGLANRLGARFTSHVAEATAGSIKGARAIGIPLRRSIVELDRGAARRAARDYFNLDPSKPCLLVFGGSQGARRINEAVAAAVPELVANNCQVLHVVGSNNLDQGEDLAAHHVSGYRRVDYVERMDLAYAAADLAMCRAGAMTCAELSAVGLPAVYVPLPIGNGEQQLNAAPVVNSGGGQFLMDADLSPDNVVQRTVPLLTNPYRIEAMSNAASAHGVRDAGARLARMVQDALEVGR